MADYRAVHIEMAETVFAITTDREDDSIRVDDAFEPFRSSAPPQVTLTAFGSAMPAIFPLERDMVFEAWERWGLYRIDGQNVLVQRHSVSTAIPDRIVVIDRHLRRGQMFVRRPVQKDASSTVLPNPLEYPLGQVLMISLLAMSRGLLVHACGAEIDGRGLFFAGNSGDGKSTVAGLLANRGRVLCDERIVLRLREGRLWMYGTPWHGDFPSVSPEGMPVDKIFFLKRGSENRATPSKEVVSASLLLARSFPPLWDAAGMASTLGFLSQVCSDVPCYELTFRADERLVDFLLCVK